ncbi:MAG: hypothetical protein HZB75_01470 [Candidatus Saccharibacteria bacterium]|jgi:hypothetical protein|nr:MAG: hypothetical protein HZB75_01470 [Candidatus Saccharibacteria bacterium]
MTQEIEFVVLSTVAIVVSCPGATHYKVGEAMERSGLLMPNGFTTASTLPNTAVMMPAAGVNQATVMTRLLKEIESLVASGEVRI